MIGGSIARLLLVALCVFVWPQSAFSDQSLRGLALVVGQKSYANLPSLPNTLRDADDIRKLLDRLGFKVDLVADKTGRQLRRSIDGFIEDAEGADVALVYYAGHAVESGGENYLVPIDADTSSLAEASERLISLKDVLDRLRGRAKVTLLLLDACRSNPFPPAALMRSHPAAAETRVAAGGLAIPRGVALFEDGASAPESLGEVIGYAAAPGHVALDGPAGGNSPYAAALLKHLSVNQGYDFGQVMTLVTEEVYLNTGARQRPWVNASLRRFMVFGGAAEESVSDDAIIVGERRKLLLSIAETPIPTRSLIEAVAKDQALPLDPLYGMLRELQVDTSTGSRDLARQIKAGADNLKALLAEKVAPVRHDPELARLAGLADRAQAEGAIALAKEYRARAAGRADTLNATLDQREAELNADRLELASTYAEYAGTAILAFDYETAVEQYAKAHRLAEGKDAKRALDYRLGEARALLAHGGSAGVGRAIEILESTRVLTSRDADAFGWAAVQNWLGNAYAGLAVDGDDNLGKDVQAYEAALSVYTPDSAPRNWAVIQNNLGVALSRLAERDDNAALSRRAAAAYRAALTVQTRAASPLSWARTQNNLGIALARMGRHEADKSMIREAIRAYDEALTERTRVRTPYYWAATQHNRGNALLALGQLEGDGKLLNEAVAAYSAALEIRSRSDYPDEWRTSWDALGAALSELSDRGDYAAFTRVAKTTSLADLLALIAQDAKDMVDAMD